MLISVVSQKGGVGKSSLARTLASEFTKAEWNVLLADCDHAQSTSKKWCDRRATRDYQDVPCRVFRQTADAIKVEDDYDLVIIDGAPHASRGTALAASSSDLTIIPTGSSVDDLDAGIGLAQELTQTIDREKIVLALFKTTSDHQVIEAKETIENLGFQVLDGHVPAKTGYIDALDEGLSLTETKYPTLNQSSSTVIQCVINLLNKG